MKIHRDPADKKAIYPLSVRSEAMKINKASEEDLTELATLQKKYMEYHRRIDDYFTFNRNVSSAWTDYIKKVIKDKDQVVYCAFIGTKLVGYMTAAVTKRPPIYRIGRIGLIGDSFVLPEFRKQGAFSELLQKTLNWMKRHRVSFVEHPVATRNELGLKIWKTKGFEDYMTLMRKRI